VPGGDLCTLLRQTEPPLPVLNGLWQAGWDVLRGVVRPCIAHHAFVQSRVIDVAFVASHVIVVILLQSRCRT